MYLPHSITTVFNWKEKQKNNIFFLKNCFAHLCWHARSQRQIHIGDTADLIYQWLPILKEKKTNDPTPKHKSVRKEKQKRVILYIQRYILIHLLPDHMVEDLVLHIQSGTSFSAQVLL